MNSDLSTPALALALVLWQLSDFRTGLSKRPLSLTDLAKLSHLARRSVANRLPELEAAGFIVVDRPAKAEQLAHKANRYRLAVPEQSAAVVTALPELVHDVHQQAGQPEPASAGDAPELVQEMHQGGAGDAPELVQEMHSSTSSNHSNAIHSSGDALAGTSAPGASCAPSERSSPSASPRRSRRERAARRLTRHLARGLGMNEIDSKNNDAAAIELLAALDDNEPAITAAIDQAISEHKANPDSPPPTLASIAAQLDQQPERETA